MKAAALGVCLLVLTAGCIVQTEEARPETVTPSTPERIDEKAETPIQPKTPSAAEYNVEVTRIEDLVHQGMNERRVAHGLDPLNRSQKLDAIARYKSWDMAQRDYFAHRSPDGTSHATMRKRYGTSCGEQAQNIYKNTISGPDEYIKEYHDNKKQIADGAVGYLMNSTPHRKNILDPDFEVQGIGVFVDENGTVYLTQEFCG